MPEFCPLVTHKVGVIIRLIKWIKNWIDAQEKKNSSAIEIKP